MKRSIIISLMVCLAVKASACAFEESHNNYIFSVYQGCDLLDHAYEQTMKNWQQYTGNQEMTWFDADAVRQAARKKGDQAMLNYVDQLDKYLDISNSVAYSWDYPSKEELAERRAKLLTIRQYAMQHYAAGNMRQQHALLYMRCNMLMEEHQENISYWEKTATKFADSPYRVLMRNIYAGALYHSGRTEESGRIFAEHGDTQSLYTQFYEGRSFEAIKREYQRDHNSLVLPFLVEDFAKNAQEAYDSEYLQTGTEGKLFIRDLTKEECRQMQLFAHQVVKDKKTKDPALWKALEAWLIYLFGDRQEALKTIEQAATMKGSEYTKANAQVLLSYIRADVMPLGPDYYKQLASDLEWLEQKADANRTQHDNYYQNFYTGVFDRMVHQVLMKKFTDGGQSNVATALLGAYDEMPKQFMWKQQGQQGRTDPQSPWSQDYSSELFEHLQAMTAEELQSYLAYLHRGGEGTPLDEWLMKRVRHDDAFYEEVIGTLYIRQANWQQAVNHLQGVTPEFINRNMNITPFMAQRSYTVEPWLKRQRLNGSQQQPGAAFVTASQKLQFAKDMMQMEAQYRMASQTQRPQLAYNLAVRYMQASYAGDCWYLTHYGTGVYDSTLDNEIDMVAKARELLEVAQGVSDFKQKEKVLFALAYLPIEPWREVDYWNDRVTVNRSSQQYKALARLADFERRNAARTSRYVSRCDVLKQFMKQY